MNKLLRNNLTKFILNHYWFPYLLLFIAAVMLTCVQEYNPFQDYGNVGMGVVSKTFSEGEKIAVFSPETLSIRTLVGEKIDSFTLTVPDNIYWTDTTTTKKSKFYDQVYAFYLLFSDTGYKEIQIISYIADIGEKNIHTIPLYVYSFLHQDSIDIYVTVPFTLAASSVRADDVLYHWSFGNGIEIYHRNPTCATTLYKIP